MSYTDVIFALQLRVWAWWTYLAFVEKRNENFRRRRDSSSNLLHVNGQPFHRQELLAGFPEHGRWEDWLVTVVGGMQYISVRWATKTRICSKSPGILSIHLSDHWLCDQLGLESRVPARLVHMKRVDRWSIMYLTMAGCCASFPFFFFSFLSQLNRRRGKTQPSAPVLDSMTFSGYRAYLISVKSLLRGNAVEDFSAYLRARGVFVIGANVLFAYQENSITPTAGPTTPPYRLMLITGMAENDENTK